MNVDITTVSIIGAFSLALLGLFQKMVSDRRASINAAAKAKQEAADTLKMHDEAITAARIERDDRVKALVAEHDKINLEARMEREKKWDILLAKLETKMDTLWSSYNATLVGVLHHPDPAKIIPDELLKKYEASLTTPTAISQAELLELVGFMMAVSKNEALHIDERSAAVRLLTLIRQHPLWIPTQAQAGKLQEVIGADLYPKVIDKKRGDESKDGEVKSG